jgi:hypothetical protein
MLDPIPLDLYAHTPQVYGAGQDVYAFLGHDDRIRFGFAYHLDGRPWSAYIPLTTEAEGKLDGSASIRWDPLRETNANVIDTAFFDEDRLGNSTWLPELYYMAVLPGEAAPPPAGPAPPPEAPGPVAAYGFSEPSGTTAVDSSGRGNSGTISGAVRTTLGRFGSALTFDGVNDWVTVADSNSLDLSSAMTLEAWVYPTALLGSWRTVLLKEQPGHFTYALYATTDTNRPSGHVYTTADMDTRGTAQLPLNAWTHLAATWNGSTLSLYVNGVLASSRAVAGAIRTSSGALRFGGNAIWSEWFAGRLDEIRIYNRALSAAELQSDMATAVP